MNRIIAINGSPKANRGSSGAILDFLASRMGRDLTRLRTLDLLDAPDLDAMAADLLQADVLLFSFPLFVDCLPSHLIDVLTRLEQSAAQVPGPLPRVYGICNCGFYDSEQTATALTILKNFCARSGLSWQYGIGIGCGGMIAEQASTIRSHGPLSNLYSALADLCVQLESETPSSRDNLYVKPGIPRLMYHFAGNASWRSAAKTNGVRRQLRAAPHTVKSKYHS